MRADDRSRRASLESIGLAGAVAAAGVESARGSWANDTIHVACLGVDEPHREAARKPHFGSHGAWLAGGPGWPRPS